MPLHSPLKSLIVATSGGNEEEDKQEEEESDNFERSFYLAEEGQDKQMRKFSWVIRRSRAER